jgi:hypothetical protein
MPLISQDQSDAQTPVIPKTVAPSPPQAPPTLAEVRDAAFAQTNILGSVLEKAAVGGYTNYPAQPGYDPFASDGAEIKGYEQYASRFANSQSPAQTQAIKNQIGAELDDKQTLARAGGRGLAVSLATGAVDPVSLTTMLIPGLEGVGASRFARIGAIVGTNVATGEAQQAALAANSQTTSYADGILPRIGANALLGGILGGIATRVPRAELDAITRRVGEEINRPVIPSESTAGAAQVATTTLADESIARGGQTIAKTVGQVSPSTRIFANSPVVEARQLAQQLVDPGLMLEKNLRGISTPPSVEMRVNQAENIRNAQLFQKLDAEFTDYKQGGGELSKHEFSAEVADAMRNGDAHEIPQVQKVAEFTRPIFQADRAALSKLSKSMPEGEGVIGAPSYFPRVYDQHAIMANRSDIEARLTDWFERNPKTDEKTGLPVQREPAEVTSAVDDTLDRIQGTVRGTADIGQGVKNPGVLKARSLNVPDAILKPYLSHDFEHVMGAYNRAILPQLEMRRTFGSADLKDQFRTVRDAYHRQLAAAESNEAKAKLTKQMKADIADLTLLRDRALNQVGPRGNESLQVVRAAQLVRSFNYLRMLGGQTLSAIPDVGRLVTRYGLFNTGRRLAGFLGSSELRNLSKADAQRMGTALDVVLHTRQHTLEGVGDEMAGSQLGQRMHNLTANFTKITGIAHWDTMMRVLSSQLEQDALHRLINKGNVSTLERGKLAAHGIGDAELPAIREQWAQHGSDENGLNRARTELWKDRDAAQRVEQAVQRAASSNAFFVGKGDMPNSVLGFANPQVVKFILQFKAFAISSVNRLAIPLAQGLAHRDVMAANGLASMLALGALTYYVKELAAGRKADLSPDNLIPEAVQRSGILTFLPDLYDPVAGTLHLPRFAKFQDLNPLETAMGATFGTGAMLLDTVRRLSKGNIAAADLHKLRQLLPYQNLFYLTRLINAVEGKTADLIGAKHAPGKDFADYLNPAKDESPKEKPNKEHLFGMQSIPNAF